MLLLELPQRPKTGSDQAPPDLALHQSSKPRVACLRHSVGLSELPAAQEKKEINEGEYGIVNKGEAD